MQLLLRRCHGIAGFGQGKSQPVLPLLPVQFKSDPFLFPGAGEDLFCLCQIPDLHCLRYGLLRHLRSLFLEPLQVFPEIQPPAPLICLRRIRIRDPCRLQIQLYRRFHADGCQFFAHHCHVVMFPERLSRAFLTDLFQMRVGIFYTAVSHHQRRGSLFPDPRYTRDIVGGISHQRLQFDDLRRRHLINSFYVFGMIVLNLRHTLPGLRHPDHDPVRGDLQKIPVSGHDHRIKPPGFALLRRGAQKVVRLIALLHQKRNLHGRQQLLQHGDLLP